MATMKRRVVYLSDEDWETAQRLATEYRTTISAVVRVMLTGKAAAADFDEAITKVTEVVNASPSDAAKLASDLRSFNSRPFQPVPKKGK